MPDPEIRTSPPRRIKRYAAIAVTTESR